MVDCYAMKMKMSFILKNSCLFTSVGFVWAWRTCVAFTLITHQLASSRSSEPPNDDGVKVKSSTTSSSPKPVEQFVHVVT